MLKIDLRLVFLKFSSYVCNIKIINKTLSRGLNRRSGIKSGVVTDVLLTSWLTWKYAWTMKGISF